MGALGDCLKAILKPTVVAAGPDEQGKVTLSEEREGAPMRVLVSHVPDTATVVSLRKVSQHPILQQSPGQSWMKICDYMVIDDREDRCEIVMVELKTTLQRHSEGLEQLRRTLPLAKYLLSVCEVELASSWSCKFSYALIAEKRTNRLDKQPTRPLAKLETMHHEEIKVAVGIGRRFNFTALMH